MANLNEIALEPQPLGIIEGKFLWRTMREGEVIDGTDKSGAPKILSYPSGAFLLSDAELNILCGPISRGAAHLLALEIVAGNSRAATRPGIALRLATVLLGMALEPGVDPVAMAGAINPLEKARDTLSLFTDQKEAIHA